jgi:vacuolar-type H+-ATPase subunit I/STV1
MTNPRIKAIGATHANPKYFGLSWPELEGLFGEHQALATQASEVSAHISELEAQLKQEKGQLPHKRAEALHAGKGEPSTKGIENLEKQLEEVRQKSEDLKRAAALVERDVQAALRENRDKYLEEIEQKRMEAALRIRQIRAELAVPEWEMDALGRISEYLTSPNRRTDRLSFNTHVSPRPASEVEVNGG